MHSVPKFMKIRMNDLPCPVHDRNYCRPDENKERCLWILHVTGCCDYFYGTECNSFKPVVSKFRGGTGDRNDFVSDFNSQKGLSEFHALWQVHSKIYWDSGRNYENVH